MKNVENYTEKEKGSVNLKRPSFPSIYINDELINLKD